MNIKSISPEFLRILPTIMDVLHADNDYLMNSYPIQDMDDTTFEHFVLGCCNDIIDLGVENNNKVIDYVISSNLNVYSTLNNQIITPMRDITVDILDNDTGVVLSNSRIEQTDDEDLFLHRLKFAMLKVRNAPKGKLKVKFD